MNMKGMHVALQHVADWQQNPRNLKYIPKYRLETTTDNFAGRNLTDVRELGVNCMVVADSCVCCGAFYK